MLSYSHRTGLGIDDLRQADFALVGARGKRLTYRTVGRARSMIATKAKSRPAWRRGSLIAAPRQGNYR